MQGDHDGPRPRRRPGCAVEAASPRRPSNQFARSSPLLDRSAVARSWRGQSASSSRALDRTRAGRIYRSRTEQIPKPSRSTQCHHSNPAPALPLPATIPSRRPPCVCAPSARARSSARPAASAAVTAAGPAAGDRPSARPPAAARAGGATAGGAGRTRAGHQVPRASGAFGAQQRRPPPAWASGRSIPTSAASSAAPTATRGTPTATPCERSGAPRPSRLPAWEAFERRILVKTGVADVLARTLDPAPARRPPLVIGTATDPYQPAERRFRLTRGMLEALLGYRGLTLGHHHQVAARHPRHRPAAPARRAARGDASTSRSPRSSGGSPGGSSPARRCPQPGSARSAASPRPASTPVSWWRPSCPASPTAGRASDRAHGRGEGGGCPLRGRVGAPARPRGAAPLPSRARSRVSRARRALRAALRAARGRESGLPARAGGTAARAASGATAFRWTKGAGAGGSSRGVSAASRRIPSFCL